MQGLPFFSFSSQGAGPLNESAAPTSPLVAPATTGVPANTSVPDDDLTGTPLPEFMKNLLQAMTQGSSNLSMAEGQDIAAEEVLDPTTTDLTDTALAAQLLPANTMDMESIQRQRDFQPTLNPSMQADARPQALPNLLARAQAAQSNSTLEQQALSNQSLAANPTGAESAIKISSPVLNMSPITEVGAQTESLQLTFETQAKLAPQSGAMINPTLRESAINEKSLTMKGGAENTKALSMMSPLSEPTAVTERSLSTEQLASLSATGTADWSMDAGEAIDEMWQQTQPNNRALSTKAGNSAAPSFFEQIQAKLDLPPTDIRFGEQVSKRIGMMVSEQMQSVRIQLDPPELGSLEIKVRVQQEQVSVSFASNNQAVRDALESQAPRLREMLNQQGVDLGDLDVSSQGKQNQEGDGQGQNQGEQFIDEQGILASEALDDLEQQIHTIENDGSVDYFA